MALILAEQVHLQRSGEQNTTAGRHSMLRMRTWALNIRGILSLVPRPFTETAASIFAYESSIRNPEGRRLAAIFSRSLSFTSARLPILTCPGIGFQLT